MSPVPPHRRRRAISKGPTSWQLRSHPAVRNYLLFCLASLFLLIVCLSERHLGWWCLVPAVLGALTLLMHWSVGPPLVLLSLTGLLGFSRVRYPVQFREPSPTLLDLLLCLAVMAYVVGHYRLLSLVSHIFPPDPRRLGEPAEPTQRRSADLVSAREMALLGLAAPVWTGLTMAVWTWLLANSVPPWGMSEGAWRVLRLIWMFLLVVSAMAVFRAFRRMTMATPEESLLYLQDEVWRQTRREQSNLNRWLAWAQLRARRKKETP